MRWDEDGEREEGSTQGWAGSSGADSGLRVREGRAVGRERRGIGAAPAQDSPKTESSPLELPPIAGGITW